MSAISSVTPREPDFEVEIINEDEPRDCIVGGLTELAVVVNGTVDISADGGRYSLRFGQLFVRNANQDYRIEKGEKLAMYRVRFNADWVMETFPAVLKMEGYRLLFMLMPHYALRFYHNTNFKLSPSAVEYVRSLLNGMVDESSQQPEAYDVVVRCLLMNMLVFLCREFVHANISGEKNLHEISAAIAYIEKNFMNPITLEQLSGIAYLSPRHFDRIFKKIYHVSPFEYILKLRLSYACDLLKEKISISSVAEKSGFSDSNYFARCFKKEYGCTPREMRSKLAKEELDEAGLD